MMDTMLRKHMQAEQMPLEIEAESSAAAYFENKPPNIKKAAKDPQ